MDAKTLRIVFMGTPDFAVESLKALHENGYNIVGVITVPDKPAGRGQKLQQSAVKTYAMQAGLPILQPEKLKDSSFIDALKSWEADLQVIVAFRMLPEVVWSMPRMGTFNLHGSILPRYRGAAPLNWALINGDQETGVTTFLLKHEIDTGNILFCERIPIGIHDTVGEIHDKLMVVGASLVVKTVEALAEGKIVPIPQDSLPVEMAKIHAPKIFKEDCRIDWNQSAQKIHNLIRGLSPYPASWTQLKCGEKLSQVKIFRSEFQITANTAAPGTIVSDSKSYLHIATSDGWVTVLELQMAGKNRMAIADFLRGFPAITNCTVE